MSDVVIEKVIRELLARGDVLEADAIAEVTRLYANLNLAELVVLLRVASEQDSPLARVGYHDQVMQKWNAAAANLGQPPDALASMVKTAVVSGIQGTADMFAASQQVTDAFTVPPVYQVQWAKYSEKRLRDYWGAEAERLTQEVSSAVREGLERGQLTDQIAKRIQDRCGVSRSRATLIARNELGNASSFAMMESQRLAGVESYIWRTAGDHRVRPAHVARNGKEFRWDDPPADGHPGQPIMCRCVARAVIPQGGIKPIKQAESTVDNENSMPESDSDLSRRQSGLAVTVTARKLDRSPEGSSLTMKLSIDENDPELAPAVRAIEIVSRLHGDGPLPTISVKAEAGTPLGDGFAAFDHDSQTGRAFGIAVFPEAEYTSVDVVHEIGHFLDISGIGNGRSAAEAGHIDLTSWQTAIDQTDAVKQLRDLLESAGTRKRRSQPIDTGLVDYLLRPRELFARSYAQFVAITSGDAELRRDIGAEVSTDVRPLLYTAQWTDTDFDSVAEAFDQLFKKLGWWR